VDVSGQALTLCFVYCILYTEYSILVSSRIVKGFFLVIPHKSAKLDESGLLDECAPEILRCAQDDNSGLCHPERVSRSPEERRGRISRELIGNHRVFPTEPGLLQVIVKQKEKSFAAHY